MKTKVFLQALILWSTLKDNRFRRFVIGALVTGLVLILCISLFQSPAGSEPCKRTRRHYSRKNSSYLAYIMSAIPHRLNFTKSVLEARLPGFFNITHRKCVPLNDSRVYKNAGEGAGALMISYIDLWREIGSKPDEELADNDWIFLFEDDVDIIPLDILRKFYSKVYLKWNRHGQSKSLAGSLTSLANIVVFF